MNFIDDLWFMKIPTLAPPEYLSMVMGLYREAGDPKTAEGQMAYMRHKFAYFGLKAPQWVPIARELMQNQGAYPGEDLKTFVRMCFDEEYREIHYFGLQMLEKRINTLGKEDIAFLEEMICTQSWWDSVDWINKLVSIHFQRHPDLQHTIARKWIMSENFWLQRVAIIHQLRYKESTDFDLMKEMILARTDSSEFFVQKAAGWALRQHSRVDPEGVAAFVDEHEDQLSSLTKREALKHL
jgi:3-methyladenine DNA glycosylase AlkD